MKFYELAIGILVTWRLTHLLSRESGPWDLIARFRQSAGTGMLGELFACFYCLSLWIAAPLAFAVALSWRERVLLWPALSAGAILLERLASAREPEPFYSEDREDSHVLRNETTPAAN
jgi:Protein of unknown function (DUF1360)